MKTYLVVIAGKPQGPFTLEEIKQLAIKPGTFVKTEGMDDYKEAHEVAELRSLLGFAAQITQPQYFATLDIRLLAIAIDYFLVFGICLVLALATVIFIPHQNGRILVALSAMLIMPLARSVYATAMEASAKQATLGKQLLGIKVCDEAGNRLSLSRAIQRNLCKWISTLTLGIGYLMGFFSRKQQCLHDKMAGTLVVKERLL